MRRWRSGPSAAGNDRVPLLWRRSRRGRNLCTLWRCPRVHAVDGVAPGPRRAVRGPVDTAGRPTNRVRNGRKEDSDPVGGKLLPDYVEVPTARWSLRSTWLASGGDGPPSSSCCSR